MSLSAAVLPAPGAPRSAVTRPARASNETSSTAGGCSLRALLVSPKAWITHSKIARYVRFSGHRTARSATVDRLGRGATASHLGAQHRRVEQRGPTCPEQLRRAAALSGRRTTGRDQE